MYYLLLLHGNNGYAKALQRYVTRILPVLLFVIKIQALLLLWYELVAYCIENGTETTLPSYEALCGNGDTLKMR